MITKIIFWRLRKKPSAMFHSSKKGTKPATGFFYAFHAYNAYRSINDNDLPDVCKEEHRSRESGFGIKKQEHKI